MAYVRFGPAIIAAVALFLSATGIEGTDGTVAILDNVAAEYHENILGTLQYFKSKKNVSYFLKINLCGRG